MYEINYLIRSLLYTLYYSLEIIREIIIICKCKENSIVFVDCENY